MPNWVFNTINASDEVLADMKEKFINKDGQFDFNYIIPMPKSLDITSGSTNSTDVYYYLSEKNTLSYEDTMNKPNARAITEEGGWGYLGKSIVDRVAEMVTNGNEPDYDMGRTLVENYEKYGHTTWYDWCIEHWGTKWNACNTQLDDVAIRFDTAWDVPRPILEKLCSWYPNKDIGIYSEEESGWFVEFENNNGTLTVTDEGNIDEEEEEE